ncbi:hypothetical protein C0J52_11714, partial [Blattella germanica]
EKYKIYNIQNTKIQQSTRISRARGRGSSVAVEINRKAEKISVIRTVHENKNE